jgi:hypothetical protein
MNAPAERSGASRLTILSCLALWLGAGAVSAAVAAEPAKPAPVKWATFTSGDGSFMISVPEGYTVEPNYRYDQLGPGKTISGTSFTIPERMWQGSNLASDTYLSVETLPAAADCTADLFLQGGETAKAVTDKGVAYSLATMGEGGAGNAYEQTVYALRTSRPCTAVRTFIHSTNIGNYDPGSVAEFNHAALVAQFDKIRRSLKLK